MMQPHKIVGMLSLAAGAALIARGFVPSRRSKLQSAIEDVLSAAADQPAPRTYSDAERQQFAQAVAALAALRSMVRLQWTRPAALQPIIDELRSSAEPDPASLRWYDALTMGATWAARVLTRPRQEPAEPIAPATQRLTRQASAPWAQTLQPIASDAYRHPQHGRYEYQRPSDEFLLAINRLNMAMRWAGAGELPQVVLAADLKTLVGRMKFEPQLAQKIAVAWAWLGEEGLDRQLADHLHACEGGQAGLVGRIYQTAAALVGRRGAWAEHVRAQQAGCHAARIFAPVES